MKRIFFLILIVVFNSGFNVRDQPESRFPRSVSMGESYGPKVMESDDLLWKNFEQCKLKSGKDFSYSITYTNSVKAFNGKKITLSGFILPLVSKEKFNHFLLVRRAPTCAFCSPGAPNEVVEVFSSKSLIWEDNLVTISGTLILPKKETHGIFFQINDAVKQ